MNPLSPSASTAPHLGLPMTSTPSGAHPTSSWTRHALLLSLVLLVVLRLALIFAVDVKPSSDPAWYYERAIELLRSGSYSEGGIPTAYWPVGYAAFLAPLMMAFGQSLLVCQLANVALSALCLVLLHRWCRLRWADERVAAVAVLLFAVYPNQIGYSAVPYSEPLFTALLLAIMVLTRPDASLWRLAVLGLLAGVATLVKAQMQLLAPLLLWLLLLPGWNGKVVWNATYKTALAVFVMALTIAPWTCRNYAQFGAFIPVSTNGGMSLLAGNNPSMPIGLGGGEFPADDPLLNSVAFSVVNQVAADKQARQLAKGWIMDNPGRFIAIMPRKILRLWLWDGESEWMFQRGDAHYAQRENWYRGARIVNQIFYSIVLGAGLIGLGSMTKPSRPVTLAAPMLLFFFTAISMVFSGQSRYHAPLVPFLCAGSAWAFMRLRDRWSRP